MDVSPTYLSTLSGINTPVLPLAGATGAVNGTLGWHANRGIVVPFFIPAPFQLQRAFFINSANACNVDLGVYDFQLNRLFSTGSLASGHTNVVQYAAASGLRLKPGRYYLGFACDTGTDVSQPLFFALATTTSQRVFQLAGCLQMEAAFPLPATFVPVTLTTSVYPCFGFTQTAS